VVWERISFYFHSDYSHSDVKITQNVSFRIGNQLKIGPQRQIGFMHVTSPVKIPAALGVLSSFSSKQLLKIQARRPCSSGTGITSDEISTLHKNLFIKLAFVNLTGSQTLG
jgi:hypothetical protein